MRSERDASHLMAGIGRVRQAMERSGGDAAPLPSLPDATSEESPLAAVCARFGLTTFERDVLLLCAAMELEGDFADLCAAIQGPHAAYPTFGLALSRLEGGHWSALAPTGPLRRWSLVETSPAAALVTSALRIDERILHYLLTGPGAVESAVPGLDHVRSGRELLASESAVADRISGLWGSAGDQALPVLDLSGAKTATLRAIAVEATHRAGWRAMLLDGAFVPALPGDLEAFRLRIEREARLEGGALILNAGEGGGRDPAREAALGLFLSRYEGPALVLEGRSEGIPGRTLVRVEAGRLDAHEQEAAWHERLGLRRADLKQPVGDLVAQFSLSYEEIASVAAVARGASEGAGRKRVAEAWTICRDRARAALGTSAQRVEALARWEDLVLPPGHLELLKGVCAQVRNRALVHNEWGFAARGARGLGISALFWGASGTGKTMAAEAMAGALGLDLYRIDLASVVSKYIGETEKNLRQVFDAADDSGAILLFDEADALFGKRSEVKDSHDRFANIEVGYLLQRLEAYRGLAVLTTNLRDSLDPAFTRRLGLVLEFPFPDFDGRAALWRRAFPVATPTQGLDPCKLAQLNVAGGNIRNIALYAAFLAAEDGQPVTMSHVLRASRFEYQKLGRPLGGLEVRGWV